MAMVGTGDWIDEDDMKAKYKNKPARLSSILRNCKRWYDPQGEVELLEDMAYQSKSTAKDTVAVSNKRKITAEENIKKEPTPKTAKGQQVTGNEDEHAKENDTHTKS